MVAEESLDASDLGARKSSIALQSDGVKPELRQLVIMLNLHMQRLLSISCVKKETVGTDSENGWHCLSFIAFFPLEKESPRFFGILLQGLMRRTPQLTASRPAEAIHVQQEPQPGGGHVHGAD